MRVQVNGALGLSASFLLLVALSALADEGEGEKREPGWTPAVAVTSGFTIQYQEASARSTIDTTSGTFVAGTELIDGDSGQEWAVSPYVGVNVELMTPEIPSSRGVRFFVNGEYLPSFGADLDIAKSGDPKGFDIPVVNGPPCGLIDPGCNCPFGMGCFPEEGIGGVGSRTTATVEQDVFGAAVGIAVPFELLGRNMMLKPSFGWIRYSVDVQGVVLRAIKLPVTVLANPQVRPVPIIRTVELGGETTQSFNAIGPGLELEMEVHQAGPVQASLFVDAHGYKVLGKRHVGFSDSTSAQCSETVPALIFICGLQYGNGPSDYSADFDFRVDPWLYRVGIGFRFRWTGE